MVQVFKREIEDGLQQQMQSDTSIALALDAKVIVKPTDAELLKTIANMDSFNKQIDLFYFESILVSTGWNINEDIFDKAETWKAKDTPVNKKINYMHDESDIIGHMVTSRVVDDQTRVIPLNTPIEQIPDNFDILVGGVLYKIWENPELQARMDSIIADMGNGKWKVSMECVYPHFDYGVITPNGEHKIIQRNDQSSFLSKYLKRYGGTGEFEGYRIGRVLRGIIFSGKGIVDTPANPRSVITKTEYSEFLGTAASVDILPMERKIMADNVISVEQYNELKSRLEKAEAAAKDAAEKSVAKEKEVFQTTIAQLEKDKLALANELSATKEIVKAHETKVVSVEKELTEAKSNLAKANEDLAKVAKEALKANRLAMFNDVDVDSAKAEELVNKFIDTSDDIFSELVKAMPKKKADAAKDKKEDDKETDASKALADAKLTDSNANVTPDLDKKAEVVKATQAWLSDKLFKSTAKKGDK